MSNIGVMLKTVSGNCTLNCTYCYYGRDKCGAPGISRLDPEALDKFIGEYLGYVRKTGSFVWQGGEPLLAGIGFFRKVLEMETRHAKPGTILANAIQTNGILLNEEWADLFYRYNFLVGVSLDGPREINDASRVFPGGKSSFDQVMRGVEILRRYRVPFNILTVIGPHNVGRAVDIINFFLSRGFYYLQFIPCMDFQASEGTKPAQYQITPGEYGEFLCQVFDHWMGEDMHPRFSLRLFNNMLAKFIGISPDWCQFRGRCGDTLVIESNGDVFPCDFYLNSSWRLGNIRDNAFEELAKNPKRNTFARHKAKLPAQCLNCPWKQICMGGCPRNRMGQNGDYSGPDFFCHAYRRLFDHAGKKLKKLALSLK